MFKDNVFVAYEGLDASGKTTQVQRLFDAFGGLGPDLGEYAGTTGTRTLKFPLYHTPTGKMIARYLNGNMPYVAAEDNARLLQSLMLTNRYEVVDDMLGHLNRGHNLIVDRYWASGVVYGGADGLDPNWNWQIQQQLPMPDIYILLDIPSEVSFARRPDRQDAYESDKARLSHVEQGYRKLWQDAAPLTSWRGTATRWVHLDGTLPEDVLRQQIADVVAEYRKTL